MVLLSGAQQPNLDIFGRLLIGVGILKKVAICVKGHLNCTVTREALDALRVRKSRTHQRAS
jgi:hypothetical protein